MSKAPPNKKLKQMDLQSFIQQSPKKQTARDDESGQTSQASDNVQKTIAPSFKKEDKEEPSKDLKQEAEEKKHSFQFLLNSETYSVSCNTSMTVLEALHTSQMFRIEKDKKKNIEKEILIQRSKGKVPNAAVKTDFPCCLIEKDEILDITLIKMDGISSTNQQTIADPSLLSKRRKPETLVTFWVKKEGGPGVSCLLKSKALRKSVRYVCVFAFRGEKVKTALKRDGRFDKVIFSKHCGLSEMGMEIKHELSIPVEDLDGKVFQVVVISDNNLPESQDDDALVKTEPNVALDADGAEDIGPSHNPIDNEQERKQDGKTTKSTNCLNKRYAVKPIENSEEILGILRDQFKGLLETLMQRENLKNNSQVQRFFREEYHKSVENFSEVKKVKELMKLSNSVCQIRVGESINGSVGTGFLLFDRFVLTNAHVIGIQTELTPVELAQFRAVFDYEDIDSPSKIESIPVTQVKAYFYGKDDRGRHLDFALLELAADNKIIGSKDPELYPKLFSSYRPNPPNNRGQICIVGHPHKDVKKIDPCFIIERENRQEAAEKHKSENTQFIQVMREKDFEEKWDFTAYDNQITYDSCFFHGSSGSPVFDADCNLIGIHTGGYKYKENKRKTWSVMEYGFTLQPILDMIRAQAKMKGFHDIIKIFEDAEQQHQTDIEMFDAEESEEFEESEES